MREFLFERCPGITDHIQLQIETAAKAICLAAASSPFRSSFKLSNRRSPETNLICTDLEPVA